MFYVSCCVIVDKAYEPPQKRNRRSASVKDDVFVSDRRSKSRPSKIAAIAKLSQMVKHDSKIKENGELTVDEEAEDKHNEKKKSRKDKHGHGRSSHKSKKDRRSRHDHGHSRSSHKYRSDRKSSHSRKRSDKSVSFREPLISVDESKVEESDAKQQDLMSMIQEMHENLYKASIFKSITFEEYKLAVGWVPTTEPFVVNLYYSGHDASTALDKVFISEADFAHCVIVGLLSVLYDIHSWFVSINTKITLPAFFDKNFLQDVINHSMYVYSLCVFVTNVVLF